MKQNYLSFLKIDVWIQFFLISASLVSAFTVVGLVITILILCGWQMLSTIIGYYYLRDKMHGNYLIAFAGFIGIVCAISFFEVSVFISLPLIIVTPWLIAASYYDASRELQIPLEKEESILYDDLLDEQLLHLKSTN